MKTDRELLEEILKALSRIELFLSSSSESDNSEGNHKQPAHRSTITGKADIGRFDQKSKIHIATASRNGKKRQRCSQKYGIW
jgi:hypothetical protein